MFTYNSAINAEREVNDGDIIQRIAMIGLKTSDISLTTSNDTNLMGGGGTDKGWTGEGTLNFGGSNGFSLSYVNFTGAYDIRQEPENGGNISYGSYYEQTPYQQSLNNSAFRLDNKNGTFFGGPSDGSIQDFIHSKTNTGQFHYPDD